ncbi:ABC transporter permease [Aureimonas jatrophae]|uniref:ABC-2 type transport system permease protein n=1 Tax=Aureimonas jatrophae TaxID=1166073 RepID=A0A1H0K9G1_9HYPH|nr:ABC transporter permease [Aureimonas jatrophae]MBB3951014.1 ABC-2 type transport system permease protein [Aureimonas jatrophae]SDO52595.1 ABC-2 type transport system permease protein [Aureimonas jatrophae]
MIAIVLAYARSFLRDRTGCVMTLVLPPLLYLVFGMIFTADIQKEIRSTVHVLDTVRNDRSAAVVKGLGAIYGDGLHAARDTRDIEESVGSGLSDAGLVIRGTPDAPLSFDIVRGAEDPLTVMTLAGQASGIVDRMHDRKFEAARVSHRLVGPEGDYQRTYLAGTVSTLFVFFAAMHGAMIGLDDRRSGLQARLVLAAGGMGRIVGARIVWLTIVGLLQTLCVFAVAYRYVPVADHLSGLAWLVTATAVAFAAGGIAMALCAICRSREQAQPFSTALFLLLAALGGTMFPSYLMPSDIQEWSWVTPHAWAVECYRLVVWQGDISRNVFVGWAVLATVGFGGTVFAMVSEGYKGSWSAP